MSCPMRSRVALLFVVTSLFSGMLMLRSEGERPRSRTTERPVPIECLLQGTWLLSEIEQSWIVTDQSDGLAGLRSVGHNRIPEMEFVEADQMEDAVALTISGDTYVTREGSLVVGRGQ